MERKSQAHFRFIDALEINTHKLGCKFSALDDVPGIQKSVDAECERRPISVRFMA